MAKHKVTTDPSTAYTGTVVDIESVEGQYGAQYKITFEDGTEIYEKTDAVERQLGRLSIGVADILGETLRFSRTPMKNDPSKGFLNIDKVRAAAPAPKRPGASAKAAHAAGPLVPGLDALDDFDIVEEDAAVTADLQRALSTPKRNETAPLTRTASANHIEASNTPAIDHAARAQVKYGRHLEFVLDQVVPAVLARAPELAFDINAAVATLMIEEAKR